MENKNQRLNDDKRRTIEDNFDLKPDGHRVFKKGNKCGSFPRKLTLTYLTKLIRKDEKINPKKKPLLKIYIDLLRTHPYLLDKFISRYVPTTTINQLTGEGGEPLSIILKKVFYNEKINEP